jgi:hypothetical protein
VEGALLACGVVPLGMQLLLFLYDALAGDPPATLPLFKAYYCWTAAACLLGLIWVGCCARVFGRQRWWVVLLAAGWWVSVFAVGGWFLYGVGMDDAGQYYWSIWGSGE